MHRFCSRWRLLALAGAASAALGLGCEPPASRKVEPAATVSTASSGEAMPSVKPPPAAEGATAADDARASDVKVRILDFEGIERLIASHRGKVVVMDAWSTSCAPCLREFPHLVDLHREHAAGDLACVSLSFDFEGLPDTKPADDLPRVLKFLEAKHATFDNILSSDASDDLYRRFHLASIPAVFVYDRQGACASGSTMKTRTRAEAPSRIGRYRNWSSSSFENPRASRDSLDVGVCPLAAEVACGAMRPTLLYDPFGVDPRVARPPLRGGEGGSRNCVHGVYAFLGATRAARAVKGASNATRPRIAFDLARALAANCWHGICTRRGSKIFFLLRRLGLTRFDGPGRLQ